MECVAFGFCIDPRRQPTGLLARGGSSLVTFMCRPFMFAVLNAKVFPPPAVRDPKPSETHAIWGSQPFGLVMGYACQYAPSLESIVVCNIIIMHVERRPVRSATALRLLLCTRMLF